MLSAIQEKLGDLVKSTWADDMDSWGNLVALYRDYYDGNHRAKLTTEMRQMLRIDDATTEQFNANYCEMVVNTMAERLVVTGIAGDNDQATAWCETLLADNRFDGLQVDIHEATIRDGDTFLMAAFDNDKKQVTLAHELAWDNDCGMLVVYDRWLKNILVAIKVWYEGDNRFVNFYYADRVEKYDYRTFEERQADGTMQTVSKLVMQGDEPADWTMNSGEAIGVPVIHFKNRGRSRRSRGISEQACAVPLQDALNRTLVSMVMTAELTAFGLRKAKGFVPEQDVAPGKWIYFGTEQNIDPAILSAMDASMMDQGEISPFIEQAGFIIDQIGTISRTPLPATMGGDTQSGEALKQRETGLLSKIGRFHTKVGNTWEDAVALAHQVAEAFSTNPPPASGSWSCKWKDAQVRNNTETIQNALAVKDLVGEKEVLRLVAAVFGYTEDQIERILVEKQEQSTVRLQNLMRGQLPGFPQ